MTQIARTRGTKDMTGVAHSSSWKHRSIILGIIGFFIVALIVSILGIFNLTPTTMTLLFAVLIANVGLILGFLQALFQVFTREEVKIYLKEHLPGRASLLKQVPPQGKRTARKLIIGLIVFLLLSIFLLPLTYVFYLYPTYARDKCYTYPVNDVGKVVANQLKPDGINVLAENNECIGISAGNFFFDERQDSNLKKDVADVFTSGDIQTAKNLWKKILDNESNNAETLIYQENQRVLDSKHPYITLIAATTLSGDKLSISVGESHLQGVYVAQKEYNDNFSLTGGVQVRILIANMGGNSLYAGLAAQQIEEAVHQDPTIVGVVGFPQSTNVEPTVRKLGDDHILMVSPTASADAFSGISPFFFRVCPSNKSQSIVDAHYAENQLRARNIAIFVDPSNPYSQSLGRDFQNQFTADGYSIAANEQYTGDKTETIVTAMNDALTHHPDLIFFPGYSNDADTLLQNLADEGSDLKVLGGDSLYSLVYDQYIPATYGRVYFTTFAYVDMDNTPVLANFRDNYKKDFGGKYPDQHPNPYGFTRADNKVIMSYDATRLLLEGSKRIGKQQFSMRELQQALQNITESNPVQGASGPIAFRSSTDPSWPAGDPVNKRVVVLYVDQGGHTQIDPTAAN